MKQVCVDHEPVIITRKDENAVVMVSLENFKSLEETAYLLRSPAAPRAPSAYWNRLASWKAAGARDGQLAG